MSTKESGLLLGLDDSYCSRQVRMEITFKGQEQGNVRGQGTEMGTWMGNREREQRPGWGYVITRKEMTAALTGNG